MSEYCSGDRPLRGPQISSMSTDVIVSFFSSRSATFSIRSLFSSSIASAFFIDVVKIRCVAKSISRPVASLPSSFPVSPT